MSNGNQAYSNSLHYIGEDKNQYESAILNVGEVIEPYDSDKLFPFYGFGGEPNYLNGSTSHCFPINFNENDAEIKGIQGVVETYRKSLKAVDLSGPTKFGPLLKKFNDDVIASMDKNCYQILLILTDG